jgi:hypothetical protein
MHQDTGMAAFTAGKLPDPDGNTGTNNNYFN